MIILKPVITEKSMLAARLGLYTFKVLGDSNKYQVQGAIESSFKVHVTRVNISRRHIPAPRTGAKRLAGKSSFAKLAVVKLKSGESIDLFDLKETK